MPARRLLSILPLLLALLLAGSPEGAAGAGAGGNGTCPLDLSYVPAFPWDPTPCAGSAPNITACRQTLLSLLGIGLAGRLRATGQFRLPSAGAAAACLAGLADGISAPPASLPGASLVRSCFPSPADFVSTPSYCAGVTTAAEYRAVVGNDSVAGLDAACGPELASLPVCYNCLTAGIVATSHLIAADANASAESQRNCFYLTVIYAAGISSVEGPTSLSTANCTLGLGLATQPSHPSKSNSTTIYATTIPIAIILLLSAIAFFLWRRKRRHANAKKTRDLNIPEEGSSGERRPHLRPNTGSILFSIAELSKGTDGFADKNLIGRGGFGVVYRGVLADGSIVAVKKVLNPEMEGGDEEFTNEVEIISHLRHRNLVPLRGCCIVDDDIDEGKQMFFVYDFMPNGSLEEFIFRDKEGGSQRPALTWAQRRTIIMDVAKGLEYLHYGVKPAIYHRDIKATNILLDNEMRARVADFGLARRTREGQSHLTTRVAGTHGYLAPEYALYGQLTEKSDVYSFGVLVLEILSARHVLDMSAQAGPVLITDWAWTLVKAGQSREVLDEALSTGESPRGEVMERFVLVGILCAHVMVALRPTITEAVKMLEGDMDIPEIPDRPLPYGHSLMFSEAGSNFSASPAISGPLIDNGDMLR
ncbi:probable receptor-like protein kinase At1g11050 isoform X2 [Lolium perenne]|uniref:probable receptor-like protein kinase At1g11050 isoform X2 n=1 Tax=Lolium perenne TaxID=4522 RepID=UPI0021E9FBF2|nr:probable receptor-like protein kinase At1g11050 isoform X2 [Lolium perenne]